MRFVYWLMLDSHHQFDENTPPKCEEGIPAFRYNSATSLRRVISTIADVALDPQLPTTRFVIVGNHAPPILNPGLRRQSSNSEVPFIELILR